MKGLKLFIMLCSMKGCRLFDGLLSYLKNENLISLCLNILLMVVRVVFAWVHLYNLKNSKGTSDDRSQMQAFKELMMIALPLGKQHYEPFVREKIRLFLINVIGLSPKEVENDIF